MEGFFNTPDEKPPLPEVKGLGLSPGNPFAPFVMISLVVPVVAIVVLLGLALFASSIDTRYTAGLVMMFVGALAPIPATILAIYSRNYVRLQRMQAGDAWARWRYPDVSGDGHEVYLGRLGVYWPARRRLVDFKSGLTEVEQTPDELIFRYRYKHRSRYGSYTQNKEARVPIPPGKGNEAAELVKQYQKMIGQPSDFLNDQWKIAWIMGGIIIAAVLLSMLLLIPLEVTKNDIKNNAWSTQYAITREAEGAILQRGFEPIQRVIVPQLAKLKAAGTREYQPEELGFKPADNISRVVTGFCATSESFYVLVWQQTPVIKGYFNDVPAYHYVDGEWLESCMPALYQPDGLVTVNDDWNYVYLQPNRAAAATAFALEWQKLGTPTATP